MVANKLASSRTVLSVAVQSRQRFDPLPSLASVHALDTDLIEVFVKHGGPPLGQGRRAVVFFLPCRDSVRLDACFVQRMRQSLSERAQTDKSTFFQLFLQFAKEPSFWYRTKRKISHTNWMRPAPLQSQQSLPWNARTRRTMNRTGIIYDTYGR